MNQLEMDQLETLFDEWRTLYTQARNRKLTEREKARFKQLSKEIYRWLWLSDTKP